MSRLIVPSRPLAPRRFAAGLVVALAAATLAGCIPIGFRSSTQMVLPSSPLAPAAAAATLAGD